jgi:hypothetical protein
VRKLRAILLVLTFLVLLPLFTFAQTSSSPTTPPGTPAKPAIASSPVSAGQIPPSLIGTKPAISNPAPSLTAVTGQADPAKPLVAALPAVDPTIKPETQEAPLVPEASPLNFKMSPDGTVATVLFDKESIDAMRTVISQLEQNGTLGKVKGVVYSSAGITPMLVLMGDKEELLQKLKILREFIPDQNQAHIVVISASLRELVDQDAYNIGLTLSPDIIGVQLSGTVHGNFIVEPTCRFKSILRQIGLLQSRQRFPRPISRKLLNSTRRITGGKFSLPVRSIPVTAQKLF